MTEKRYSYKPFSFKQLDHRPWTILFIYLFVYERSKLFFKMHLVLHLCLDSFHITHISSLGGPTFGLCSAWRYGDFWRFGDFKKKMV